jgi:hypothetical protein
MVATFVNPWSDCITQWCNDVQAGIAWRDDPRYHEILYEELVTTPERALTGLLHWLGHDWSPEVLSGYRRSGMPNHSAMGGPITQSSLGRWRTDLDHESRQLFRGAANELLTHLRFVDDDGWINDHQFADQLA